MSDFRISQVAASPSMTEPSTSGSERKLDRPAVVVGRAVDLQVVRPVRRRASGAVRRGRGRIWRGSALL